MNGSDRPILHLVTCSTGDYRIGSVRLSIVSPRQAPPCDAVVLEEDTWQVLAAGTDFSICTEHPIHIMTELLETKPLPAGTVLLREGWPLTIVAVVYDFDAVPCCRSPWISVALAEILRICRERQVHSLLLPLPGVRHGRLSLRKSIRLVLNVLKENTYGGLRRVLLECSSGVEEEKVRHLLAAEAELRSVSGK